jgi:hypothetical protein
VLNDENVAHLIKDALSEKAKNSFLSAADVMELVSTPEIQAQLLQAGIYHPSITKSTACRWLSRLGWHHGTHQNGMYSDGHECEDVVEYRKGFVERFTQYEHCFHTWDNEGNELVQPSGFLVPGAISRFCLVLLTHNKFTFYQNDQCKVYWGCPVKNVTPRPKGEGLTLMISEFLTSKWGPLHDDDRCVVNVFFTLKFLTLAQQSLGNILPWEEQGQLVHS